MGKEQHVSESPLPGTAVLHGLPSPSVAGLTAETEAISLWVSTAWEGEKGGESLHGIQTSEAPVPDSPTSLTLANTACLKQRRLIMHEQLCHSLCHGDSIIDRNKINKAVLLSLPLPPASHQQRFQPPSRSRGGGLWREGTHTPAWMP